MSVNFFSALAAMPMLRYFGRRKLLIFTFLGCTISLFLVAILYTSESVLAVMVIFIVMFELGPGPIAWLYMSEVLNEKGVAMGTFINWTLTLIFSLFTTQLFNDLGSTTFIVLAVTCGTGFIFVLLAVKETKDLSQTDLLNLYRPEEYKLSLRDTTFTSDDDTASDLSTSLIRTPTMKGSIKRKQLD